MNGLKIFIYINLFLINFCCISYAQSYTISGFVRDKETGEYLIGANIYFKEIQKGIATNSYGFYSLSAQKGNYHLIVTFIGYQEYQTEIYLNKNQTFNISLLPATYTTSEVTITDKRNDKNIEDIQMSQVKLPVEMIKSLPAIFGEVDILKTIQLLPGVQSAGEGNAGYYVRGGGPDQNLILLDEAIVYNASHLFGFFSIFNSDAIKDVNLIKGGMPAYYGGRLSSVLDISMKDGNFQKFQGDGGIGLISSRLTLQGPIIKDTSSFLISGRRTYADILVNPFINDTSDFKGSGYYFYDLNAKLNYNISEHDRIFLSGYFGRDVFSYNNKKSGFNIKVPWGNAMVSFRWNHIFNEHLFCNTTFVFSDYKFEFQGTQENFDMKLYSGIRDFSLKSDYTWLSKENQQIKYGLIYTLHRFMPGSVSARVGETVINPSNINRMFAHDFSAYINDEMEINGRIKINIGFRANYFQHTGPFERYKKNTLGITVDTIHYKAGEKIKDFYHFEPRFSARYSLNSTSSLKFSYTWNKQYLHLASISSVSLPTDLWIPSSDYVNPQSGYLIACGFFKNFKDNTYETSIELYYKSLSNQIEYKDGVSPGDNIGDNVDNNLTNGSGTSYGAELFLKKRYGKLNGWIGYTWAKTTRIFEEINDGKEFPAKYDRRHDLSVIATYDLNPKWSFSAVFVYATGSALTLPVSRYLIEGGILNEYGERNSFRMSPYHRMDISITFRPEQKGRVRSTWNFSVYNVYNRYNPYFIYFANEGSIQQGNFKTSAKQVSLFPIIPSITWNFNF
jgi:hypothetical protein